MSYVSTVNGQSYSEAKFAPENLNFVVTACFCDTTGNREEVIDLAHFPYQWGGEQAAVDAARAYVRKNYMPLLDNNRQISLGGGARPADQFWPTKTGKWQK